MRLIRCNGKCKQEKLAILFAPGEVKSKRPICRACRKEYQKRYTPSVRGERGWRWRQESSKLCAGSAAGSGQFYQKRKLRRTGGIAA